MKEVMTQIVISTQKSHLHIQVFDEKSDKQDGQDGRSEGSEHLTGPLDHQT